MFLIGAKLTNMKSEELISGLVVNYSWCGACVYIIFCSISVFTIKARYGVINKILQQNLDKIVIIKMSKLHLKLCQLMSNNSKMFSFQMVLLTGFCVWNTTFSLFELYMAAKDRNDFNQIFYSIAVTIGTVFFSCGIFFVLTISTLTMNEGERALKDIHDGIFLTSAKYNRKIIKTVHICLLQLQHFNANISCGLFRIDWKVMMMVSL